MDQRPIGVFDSGLGGLTTVKELRAVLPSEDIIYLGDTGRVPYGGRSRDTIIRYAEEDVAFLKNFDIKAVVIACGTVSTVALDNLKQKFSLPILGVVDAAVERAAAVTRSGRIGLIGTAASVNSGVYAAKLKALMPEVQVTSQACPLFVPLVENGRILPGDSVIEQVAHEYMQPLKAAGVDTLILGCTHYPLLWDVLTAEMGPEVTLVNAGAETARKAAGLLKENDLLKAGTAGSVRYFVTDTAADFSQTASLFLNTDINEKVTQVDLERFLVE